MLSRQQKGRGQEFDKCLILIFAPLLIIHGGRRQEHRNGQRREIQKTKRV